MSRINLLQSGMQGVDLKTNPLIIGEKKKLRFATNMQFSEGVLRSRPGFRYEALCASGQFQGATDFQPTRGLSYQPHSSADEGIALVVKGSLYLNKEKLSGNIFKSKGPVNLFQAENYLIIQNTETSTYWWDGSTLTESPGMNEVDFAEIETPVFEMEIVPPVADPRPCVDEGTGGGGAGAGCTDESTAIIIHINDSITENPIADAVFTLLLNDNEVLVGISDVNGVVEFEVPQDTYAYSVTKLGYSVVTDVKFKIKTCLERYVRLTPLTCVMEVVQARYAPGTPLTGTFIVNNNGTGVGHVTGVNLASLITSIVPPLPITVNPGEFISVTVVSPTALAGNTLEVVTTCGTYTKSWVEDVGGICGVVTSEMWYNTSYQTFQISNTGLLPITINSTTYTNNGVEYTAGALFNGESVNYPVVVSPGNTIMYILSEDSDIVPPYSIVYTCGGTEYTATGGGG